LEPLEVASAPPHFPRPPPVPNHTQSALGVALGRLLFFDRRLSSTHKVACASCHVPAYAFSVPEARPTRGVTGRALERNAPALINLAWSTTGLFWDGGAKNLESLALGPLTHEDEMGRSIELSTLLDEFSADRLYQPCFQEIFGTADVQLGQVLDVLAQYQRSLVFAGSRWDQQALGTLTLTAAERAGERVFERACARCHTPPLFTDLGFHNNGLDSDFSGPALSTKRGRMRVTQLAEDLGKFKTPSLRELSRSGPYMHDGRFRSLAAVIEHYRHGMRESSTLDPGFRAAQSARPGVAITDSEAHVLETFLQSLSSP
jgi:cytochrome c peroxidase